jgi:hypothetical protein
MNNGYIYGICSIKEHVFIFARFGFEFISPKKIEMKNLKMTHLTYLVIFHLKMIVCQNVNLPHTTYLHGHRPQKHPFVI